MVAEEVGHDLAHVVIAVDEADADPGEGLAHGDDGAPARLAFLLLRRVFADTLVVLLADLLDGEAEGLEVLDGGLVGGRFLEVALELAVEPGAPALLFHVGDELGRGAEGEAVEEVDDLLVLGEVLRAGRGVLGRGGAEEEDEGEGGEQAGHGASKIS